MKRWSTYLSGEIHTDWRQKRVEDYCSLPVSFIYLIPDHAASNTAGEHLDHANSSLCRDHQSSRVSTIKTQTLIQDYDLTVIKFGNEYKQWNAAFSKDYCSALSKPYLTLYGDRIVYH